MHKFAAVASKVGWTILRHDVTKTLVSGLIGAIATTYTGKAYSKLVDPKVVIVEIEQAKDEDAQA